MKYKLSFEVETDADPSDLLAVLEDFCGQFEDDGYGELVVVNEDTICVEDLS